MKSNSLEVFKNGANVRLHNKAIDFVEIPEKESILIRFKFADENAENPSVKHECLRGKVRVTHIALSHEAIQALIMSYKAYKMNKKQNEE